MMYPTDEELQKIATWPHDDFHGLMAYIRSRWQYADSGYWTQKGNIYYISTAGWSGNEDMIKSLFNNLAFCIIHLCAEFAGGHYIFAEKESKNEISRSLNKWIESF